MILIFWDVQITFKVGDLNYTFNKISVVGKRTRRFCTNISRVETICVDKGTQTPVARSEGENAKNDCWQIPFYHGLTLDIINKMDCDFS